MILEKVLARSAVALSEPHQAALVADQWLVDVVELLDQRVDARSVQTERLHLGDDLVLQLLILALLSVRERLPSKLQQNVLVLQAAQPLIGASNGVERLDYLRLELRLDCGDRAPTLRIVVVFAGRTLGGCFLVIACELLEWRGGGRS